jgi:hypothetical protein
MVVVAWTPTNVDISTTDFDELLGITGLCKLVNQKASSDTFCKFNVFTGNHQQLAPNGYDRYILGFWFEVFDQNIFLKFYYDNPQAEFLILTDMMPNDLILLDRCKHVQLIHWKWFLEQYPVQFSTQRKKYKISSLSNRVNEYKFFITANLLNKSDVYMTWNACYHQHVSYNYIFSPTGWPNRDKLLAHTEKLKKPVNQETFINDPGKSFSIGSTHPAYTESCVNLINETNDICWDSNFGILPGPYLTEKTWKPLLLGNALLFSGQHNIKTVLEQVGFNFEYPWQDNYSHLPGDLERLDLLLNLIDQILSMDIDKIQDGIQNSVLHNQNLIQSGHVHQYIDEKNQDGLDYLTKLL